MKTNRTPRRRTARTAVAVSGLAAAVLVGGLAGSATAAKLITGKDIKNGSIAVRDLSPQARTTFKQAKIGTDINVPTCTDTALDDCAPLLSVKIVPGSQLVTFSGSVDNLNPGAPSITNRCGLVQGGEVLTEQRLALAGNAAPGENDSFTLQQIITVPDASLPVQVRCTEMAGEGLRLVQPRLTSIKLDKVS